MGFVYLIIDVRDTQKYTVIPGKQTVVQPVQQILDYTHPVPLPVFLNAKYKDYLGQKAAEFMHYESVIFPCG